MSLTTAIWGTVTGLPVISMWGPWTEEKRKSLHVFGTKKNEGEIVHRSAKEAITLHSHTHTHTHAHARTRTRTRAHTHAHTHACIYTGTIK